MNNWMIRGLRLVAAVLVVGGGIAAVSPRTAAIAVDAVARRTGVVAEWAEWPAVADGVYVGRLHKQPGQSGRAATSVAKLDGEQPLLRWEAFLASSRQETRNSFRVWGIEAQILGLMLLLLAGAWRRDGALSPTAAPTTTPTTPRPSRLRAALARGRARLNAATARLTGSRTTAPAPTATPATPTTTPAAPTTVTHPSRPVDETGGDLEVAVPATPAEVVPEPAAEPAPAAVEAVELTVRVTRADGAIERAEFGGRKVTEAALATVVVSRTITASFQAPPPAAPTSS